MAMLDYSETSENVYLTFNQHIELKNKKFEILVHLTFKSQIAGVILVYKSHRWINLLLKSHRWRNSTLQVASLE